MVIFLAGLRQIPGMYYEAASVDGASKWAQFRKITLLLSPIIFFNLVLQVINAFQSFTQAYVVSNGPAALPTRRCSTRCTSTSAGSSSSRWAMPPPWPGCWW